MFSSYKNRLSYSQRVLKESVNLFKLKHPSWIMNDKEKESKPVLPKIRAERATPAKEIESLYQQIVQLKHKLHFWSPDKEEMQRAIDSLQFQIFRCREEVSLQFNEAQRHV